MSIDRQTRIVKVDGSLERSILIGMITSADFLKKVARIVQPELFAGEAAGTVARWVLGYHEQYREAPLRAVQGLFEEGRGELSEGDAEWVAELLASVSRQYEAEGAPQAGNEAYLLDRAAAHFKKRALQVGATKALRLLEVGRVDEAELLYAAALRSPVVMEDLGVDPFDPATVLRLREGGMRFGMSLGIGPLDAMAGPQLSEWLVMVMGPMKRGKTQFLTHCALRAKVLGLNVVYISLESGYGDMVNRVLMAAGSMVSSGSGRVRFPEYGENERIRYTEEQRPNVNDTGSVMEMLYRFGRGARGQAVMKSFPSYTAGLAEIRRYLDALEALQGFTPHVVCVDYLGAMRPPKGFTGRDIYDVNAKGLKSLSEERKCIVFSAHQGNRKTLEAMNMSPTDVPEDVRILGHVDVLYGLNQTREEKEQGVIRMNVLMHRFRRFNHYRQVRILQQPEAGQFCLDAVACDAPMPKDFDRPLGDGKEE